LGGERFLEEIRLTANLQHPNILPLFDSGTADGFLFYVMPYVDGETLRAKLDRETQLGIGESVSITVEVADALDYAHRHGVVHRDIKPENILLHDGQAMIADFGIALAVRRAGGERITQTGLSLGTPQYMSPEQATGDRELDARTDVYSLGAVVYEMLAGSAPHTAPTAQGIILKLMTEEAAPLSRLRATVPVHVDAAVARALAKLPADRFATAAEFGTALERGAATESIATMPAPRAFGARARLIPWIVAAVSLVVAAWFAVRSRTGEADALTVSSILPPAGEEFAEEESFGALSADGRRFAFVSYSERGEARLWVRSLDTSVAVVIPGLNGVRSPFWSPDARAIAFFIGDTLGIVDVAGSGWRAICASSFPTSGTWTSRQTIYFASARGVERANLDTGNCTVVIKRDSVTNTLRHPTLLPDGRHIVMAASTGNDFGLVVGDLETGTLARATPAQAEPTSMGDLLVAGRVAAEGLSQIVVRRVTNWSTLAGADVAISEGVRTMNGVFSYAVSPTGVLVYLRSRGDGEKLLVNRRGEIVDTIRQPGAWNNAMSRSHALVALGGPDHLWAYDIARRTSRPLTKGFAGYGAWAPGDSLIAYFAAADATRGARATCALHVLRLRDGADTTIDFPRIDGCLAPSDWSRDGRYLLTTNFVQNLAPGRELWAFDWRDRKWISLVKSESTIGEPMLSPDGRWLAYQSDETRTREVFVRPFLRAGEAMRVSSAGGRSPRWRDDGRELYFETPDGKIMAAPFNGAATAPVGTPQTLFTAPGFSRQIFFDGGGTSYDADGSGQRFILRITPNSPAAVLVQNWKSRLDKDGSK
ncbi:MAG: protein kinase domain-containing protein, partial [Gemmatimonadaceae bacterium]